MTAAELAISPSLGLVSRSEVQTFSCDAEDFDVIPHHPLGIKPSGNQYSAVVDLRASIGTFRVLPDEILAVLLEFLVPASLISLGATCKALYAFSVSEELWKILFLE